MLTKWDIRESMGKERRLKKFRLTHLLYVIFTFLLTRSFLVILWTRHVLENIDPNAIVNP